MKNQHYYNNLLKDGNRQIIEKDVFGNYHFNGNFNNANSLKTALDELTRKIPIAS